MINKKKFLIIGRGKWGKKVINILNDLGEIIEIIDSKTSYKKLSKKNIDWAFVLTNNSSHYKITKYFIENKINVFCEKPLCLNFKKAKKLLDLSKKNKTKIYVSDIENFKNKKIKILNINNIIRQKLDIDKKNIIFRLFYHDLYLILNNFSIKNINFLKIQDSLKGKLIFSFKANNKDFNFSYNLNKKFKIHKINKISFLNFNNDPLKKMIMNVLLQKVNFIRNNNIALQTLKIIDKIKKNKF
ncbi:Gfo/Idh/MocA family oxidoreductase [Candidatus Pelagibacter sp. Uisw_134_02]|uniref:Gfo/Idh/MocA family oxidoreductase n=1 Tax=Candidatus Pelagibacter sp. Uisw_134_02 TaxID=3230990 RepID=UPI0039EC1E5A